LDLLRLASPEYLGYLANLWGRSDRLDRSPQGHLAPPEHPALQLDRKGQWGQSRRPALQVPVLPWDLPGLSGLVPPRDLEGRWDPARRRPQPVLEAR